MAAVETSRLAEFPVFASCSEAEIRDLVFKGRSLKYPKRTTIFAQGEDATLFFVLIDGYVQASKATAGGEQLIMRYIAPGELFGIAEAIGLKQYPATAVAVVDVEVVAWPSASWAELSTAHPALASGTLRMVGERLQDAHARVIELKTDDVACRIARLLLRLASQAGRAVDSGTEIEFPLRRQDVAQLTGTTLHSASRILARWEEQNVVSSAHQRILVRNSAALARIAEGAES